MKKKHELVVQHVLIAIVSILLIISTGIGCYVLVVKLFGVEVELDNASIETKVIASTISLDRKSCNLIYSVDSEKKMIDGMILEFFNADTGKIDYVTVPANTKVQLDDEFVKSIKKYADGLEKTVSMRKLIELFGTENAYQFGELILEEALDIKISYYTVFEKNILAKYFVQNVERFYLKEDNGKYTKYEYDMYELSDTYLTKCEQVENDVTTLIQEGYQDLESNFTKQNKLGYLEDYKNAELDKVFVWNLIGEEKYNQFVIDKKLTSKLITYILEMKTQYQITQEDYNQSVELGNVNQ